MAKVQSVGDWQNLDEEGAHQLRFAKADGQTIGAVMRHALLGSDPQDEVWCEIGMLQWEPWFGYRPLFTVTSLPGQNISLSPFIVCDICGDKGHIENGQWISLVGSDTSNDGVEMPVLHGNNVSGFQDGQHFSGVEDDEYEFAVRREAGDKVESEERDADYKIYDLLGERKPSAGVDFDEDEVFLGLDYRGDDESVRKQLLDRVASYILGDRNVAYGPPHVDFQRTAEMLTALWKWKLAPGAVIEAHDIANVVTLIKLSRIQWSPEKQDNWDDGAGYFACGWEAYVLTHPDQEIKK